MADLPQDARPSAPSSGGCEGATRLLGSGYQGAVFLVDAPGGRVIVKRPTGRGLARRLRRAMLRREYRTYQQLQGVAGVPRCLGQEADDALVLEFVDGDSLRGKRLRGSERQVFFAELLALIQSVHAAGVAHGDLKRKDNILRRPDGHPCLIDFGTAVTLRGAGAFGSFLFRVVRRMDLNAWFKLKYQGQDADIDPDDLQYFDPTMTERVARVLRRGWRTLTLRGRRRARR
jgi:serine/threonine protein kinase